MCWKTSFLSFAFISYIENDVASEMEIFDLISNAFQDILLPKVEKHPKLKSEIEYLSHQYYTYKDSYMFPSKYESKTKSVLISIHNSLQSWQAEKSRNGEGEGWRFNDERWRI